MMAMSVSRTKIIPERSALTRSPIQYVTENGFSIIRLCEVDGLMTDTARERRFLVRNERGWEREVMVHFDEDLIAQVQRQRRVPLFDTSVLWVVCAERYLATYLWEENKYPPGGQLTISELSVDELVLATHWSDQQRDY
jgi:hypothetical protein